MLAYLVTTFTMPATIITAIVGLGSGLTPTLVVLPVACLVATIVLVMLSLAVLRRAGVRRERSAAFAASLSVVNVGYLGYPLFSLLFGPDSAAYLALFDLGNIVCVATILQIVVVQPGSGTRSSWRASLRMILTSPVAVAAALGIAIVVLGLDVVVAGPLRLAAPLVFANAPLGLLTVGLALARHRITPSPAVAGAVAVRQVLGLGFGLSLALLVGAEGVLFRVLTWAPALPPGLNPLLYSIRHRLDVELATSITVYSTITFIVMIATGALLRIY